jgi:hypothetical protein
VTRETIPIDAKIARNLIRDFPLDNTNMFKFELVITQDYSGIQCIHKTVPEKSYFVKFTEEKERT